MKFTKMHGAGNDFIIVDNTEGKIPAGGYSKLAATLCRRRFSVGADGLMIAEKAENGGDFKMVFYNSDGSPGEMCGNGARCIAKYGYDHGLCGEVMEIEASAGTVCGKRIDDKYYSIRLNDITEMDLNRKLKALGKEYMCAYVELGNPGIPHVVLEMGGLSDSTPESMRELGSALRREDSLRKGANINFWEILGRDRIFVRTFERGVEDFTYACGTGTGSAVAVLTELGIVSGRSVEAVVAGGVLTVDVEKEAGRIAGLLLSGPAVSVAEGDALGVDL